ncbi:MAG: hypothetical protein KDC79_04760 [Cyclobacteriaceae bacterium]|nr:hypothetical protein [Cyclobacteriaceae bacterium]
MDIQAKKLNLIEWLAGVNDSKLISQFMLLMEANLEGGKSVLSDAEKRAIDQGLSSLEAGKVYSHEEASAKTRAKYPDLFK